MSGCDCVILCDHHNIVASIRKKYIVVNLLIVRGLFTLSKLSTNATPANVE